MQVYLDVSFHFFALNCYWEVLSQKSRCAQIVQDILVCTGTCSPTILFKMMLFENDSGTVFKGISDLFICALKRHHCRLYFKFGFK